MNIAQQLDALSALRVEHTQLPEQKMAAILRQLVPELAEQVQAIVREFDDHEAQLTAEMVTLEATIKAYVLETGAGATGTYLQAIPIAPRITWDTKAMEVYRTFHPEVEPYRKVSEPGAQIRARSIKRL